MLKIKQLNNTDRRTNRQTGNGNNNTLHTNFSKFTQIYVGLTLLDSEQQFKKTTNSKMSMENKLKLIPTLHYKYILDLIDLTI